MKYIITFLLLSLNLMSQIKIEWVVDKNKEKADITIFNVSDDSIVFPLNKKSLQAYFVDNQLITRDSWSGQYPFFAPVLTVYDKTSQSRVSTDSSIPYSDHSEKEYRNTSSQRKYDSIIKDWKKLNKIEDSFIAQVNYYIINHLIVLKPKEKIRFSTVFNLRNITNQENGIHDSYLLEEEIAYTALLTLDIDEANYDYLTQKQKQKYKKYKLFKGRVESNKIEIK
ncbi:hypothetical protein [Chryseobacterium indologenes]|uniref:Uncharacterized protein n=1 Tax=Chryseobacterium indologenes TaxID=253 RepID=A0A0N0ZT55_CHRID|nr:hypothetical protein [Chryseobacterium indologenes]KPE48975.1 hypothetical protein AOB46_22515 [Chryseobacterium indologenes]